MELEPCEIYEAGDVLALRFVDGSLHLMLVIGPRGNAEETMDSMLVRELDAAYGGAWARRLPGRRRRACQNCHKPEQEHQENERCLFGSMSFKAMHTRIKK